MSRAGKFRGGDMARARAAERDMFAGTVGTRRLLSAAKVGVRRRYRCEDPRCGFRFKTTERVTTCPSCRAARAQHIGEADA